MPHKQRTLRGFLLRAVTPLLLALVAAVGGVFLRFRQVMAENDTRIHESSRLVTTDCGPIEVGTVGEGRPVLVLHGAGGGYDQGLLAAEQLGEGYRVIAPSRFGYLGTPIPDDATVSAQADAYACLLDQLGIERVSVIAVSAGGPSALQFALRYPQRVDALILVSAVSTLRPIRDDSSGPSSAMLTDFVLWLATTAAPDTVLSAVGVPPASLAKVTPAERAQMQTTVDIFQPMSRRLPGMNLDALEQDRPEVAALPLEDISAPTLVIHALDDSLIPIAQGENSAARIPGARLVTLDYGGHFAFVTEAATREIRAFLDRPR
jgi:pimeloyl-ACP methyl ester carboxylesterase